ncbi:MAG: DMT family transporter, partial [bacterium]
MNLDKKTYGQGVLAILVAALLWSTLGIMGKLLIKVGVDIIAGVSLRPFFAFLILVALRPIFPKKREVSAERGFHKVLFFALFGFIGVSLFYILYFLAVKITSISVAVILLYTAPIWVLAFSLLSRWEKFSLEKGVGIFFSILGIFLIAQSSWGEFSFSGLLAGLGSAVTYALFTYFGKITLEKYDLGTVLTWVFGFGTLGFVPFWLLKPELLIQLVHHPTAIFISFLLGLGPTAISYGAYLWALNYV